MMHQRDMGYCVLRNQEYRVDNNTFPQQKFPSTTPDSLRLLRDTLTLSSVNDAPFDSYLRWFQVFVNGVIYLLADDDFDFVNPLRSNFIIYFDLKSEKFGEVCLPERLVHTRYLDVKKVNDSLGLLEYYLEGEASVCGVWTRKDGANEQFIKIYTVKVEGKSLYGRVLGFRNNGDVVIEVVDDDHFGDSEIEVYEPSKSVGIVIPIPKVGYTVSEKFGEVCLPERLVHTRFLDVKNVNDSLGLLKYYLEGEASVCGVWTRKDGANELFTKIYTVKVEGKSLYDRVLGFRNNGDVVIEVVDDDHFGDSKIEVYEPSSGHINGVGINGKRGKASHGVKINVTQKRKPQAINQSNFIIYFDLKSEKFCEVCLPKRLVHARYLDVKKVEGKSLYSRVLGFRNNGDVVIEVVDDDHFGDSEIEVYEPSHSAVSNEDRIQKISHSIFVTNFPDSINLRDLWRECIAYGTVVDVFIPLKKSQAGK
nr:putative F-box domain-containing protein [Tanacetum cinerariifolium]